MSRQSLRAKAQDERYYLVYFEEEGSYSVVQKKQLMVENCVVDDSVLVKCGKSTYPAKVEAMGSKREMEQLEDAFLESDDIPSQKETGTPSAKKLKASKPKEIEKGKGKKKKAKASSKTKKRKEAQEKKKAGKAKGNILFVSSKHEEKESAVEDVAMAESSSLEEDVVKIVDKDLVESSDEENSDISLAETPPPEKVCVVESSDEEDSDIFSLPETPPPLPPPMPSLPSLTGDHECEAPPLPPPMPSLTDHECQDLFGRRQAQFSKTMETLEAAVESMRQTQELLLQHVGRLVQPPWHQPHPWQQPHLYNSWTEPDMSQHFASTSSLSTPSSSSQPTSSQTTPSASTPQTTPSASTPSASTPARSPLTPLQEKQPVFPAHHKPLPIKRKSTSLDSCEIKDWPNRSSVQQVIEANFKLTKLNKASTLAVKLAKDAVLGEDVMRRCTPLGGRDLPALPTEELFFLKKSIFDLFPTEWKNPEEFEATWSNCIDSIGQACKRIRAPKK